MDFQTALRLDSIVGDLKGIAKDGVSRDELGEVFELIADLKDVRADARESDMSRAEIRELNDSIRDIRRAAFSSIFGGGERAGERMMDAAEDLDGIVQDDLPWGSVGDSDGATDGVSETVDNLLDMAKSLIGAGKPEDAQQLIEAVITLLKNLLSQQGPGGDAGPAAQMFEGKDLLDAMTAEGGYAKEAKGGVGVGGGAFRPGMSEVNLGQALFFDVPNGATAEGATVEIGKLFKNGPDGFYTERATVIAYDAEGNKVGEYEVNGDRDGNVTLEIDQPFARLEFRPMENGAGRSSFNSDFVVNAIEINPGNGPAASDGPSGSATSSTDGDSDNNKLLLDLISALLPIIVSVMSGNPAAMSQALDGIVNLLSSLNQRMSEQAA